MRVRAIRSCKYGSQWHIPGQKSEMFDLPPAIAEEWIDKRTVVAVEVAVSEPEPTEVGLPDDLPYRSVFVGLGFDSLTAIREVSDLTTLKGVGKKSAASVLRYLGG